MTYPAQPWDDAAGPEYDALRLLPQHLAAQVYRRAYRRAQRLALTSFKGILFFMLVPILVTGSFFGVWFLAGAVGGGPVRLAIDVVYHVLLFKLLIPPMNRSITSYLRPFVWEELQALADALDYESKISPQWAPVMVEQ